jgi:signal transduction histidine kinase
VIQTDVNGFVIFDGNDGLFVQREEGGVPVYGRELVVEGATERGQFAPVIRANKITDLGEADLLARKITEFSELESGLLDCQWVEVEGVLHYSAYVVLSSGTGQLSLSFSHTSFEEVQKWVGSRVRVRAACGHYFNLHGQLDGTRLVVPLTAEVKVLEASLPSAEIPLARIDSLLRDTYRAQPEGRVHIRGVVTYQRGRSELYVQQEQRGVYVQYIDQRNLAVGDIVDLVGFIRRGVFFPEIEYAETKIYGHQANVVARPVTAAEARIADGELIEVTGVLLDYFSGEETIVLTLKADGAPVSAVIPGDVKEHALPVAGSLVQLTGFVRIIQAPAIGTPFPGIPSSFELRLRTANDLVVRQQPPISLTVWGFGIAIVLTSLALLIAGIQWWRSQSKLREQRMHRITREAEFEAMMKERMRLAREIHDNLAQGFTAVSIQLEIAKHKLPAEATLAFGHIESARALVRESLAEARQAIQGLRRESLSNADFVAALTRSSNRILKDTAIGFHSELL